MKSDETKVSFQTPGISHVKDLNAKLHHIYIGMDNLCVKSFVKINNIDRPFDIH